jgi:hypothetical protein
MSNPAEIIRQYLLRDVTDRTATEVVDDQASPSEGILESSFTEDEVPEYLMYSLKTLWSRDLGPRFSGSLADYIVSLPGDGKGKVGGCITIVTRQSWEDTVPPDAILALDDPASCYVWIDFLVDKDLQLQDDTLQAVRDRIQWLIDAPTRTQYRGLQGNIPARDPDTGVLYDNGIQDSPFLCFFFGDIRPVTTTRFAFRYRVEYLKTFGR